MYWFIPIHIVLYILKLFCTSLRILWDLINQYKSIQIHTNPSKSIQTHTNPYKSVQIHTNPYKSMQILPEDALEASQVCMCAWGTKLHPQRCEARLVNAFLWGAKSCEGHREQIGIYLDLYGFVWIYMDLYWFICGIMCFIWI